MGWLWGRLPGTPTTCDLPAVGVLGSGVSQMTGNVANSSPEPSTVEPRASALATYRSVFQAPGSLAFCLAALVMRAPLAMYPLGIVLFISAQSGRYGLAGALAGAYTIASGLLGPLLSRAVDRRGQSALLLPAALIHVVGVAGLLVLGLSEAPGWTLFFPTALLGASYLNVISLVRARWTHVLGGGRELITAYSLESVLDELVFVLCPVIVTVLAVLHPSLGLGLAAVFVLVGSLWLRSRKDSEPPAHPKEAGIAHRSPMALPAMRWLTASMTFIGGIFGSAEVAMVAFAGDHGHRAAAGLLLAMFGLGSMLSALVYGSRHWKLSLRTRFAIQTAIFGVLPPLLLIAGSIPALAVIALVVGLGTGPTLIAGFGLVERIVAGSSLTEGLTWAGTGMSFGYATGSAVVGTVADHYSPHAAFWVSVISGVCLVIAGQMTLRTARAAEVGDVHASESQPAPVPH
jgi:hypothetical protein